MKEKKNEKEKEYSYFPQDKIWNAEYRILNKFEILGN